MATCRSWRYVPPADPQHPSGHLPGRCRTCWRPCRNKVERGSTRCPDCLVALLGHPEPRVRLALAQEKNVDTQTLQLLVDDMDLSVADAAHHALAHRNAALTYDAGVVIDWNIEEGS